MIVKNTCKNLFRSIPFWLMLAVLIIAVFYSTILVNQYGVYMEEYNEVIWDTDSRYILDYDTYLKAVINSLNSILTPYMAMMTVIATVIILARDYNDNFFEIEKSCGISHFKYVFYRLFSIIFVNFIIMILLHFAMLYIYVYTRGGIADFGLWNLIKDSLIRLFRIDVFIGLPYIIFYTAFTYFIGTIFKRSIPAAVLGLLYSILCFIFGKHFMLAYGKSTEIFQDYLQPKPMKVFWFFYDLDTETFQNTIDHFKTSHETVAICIGLLLGISLLYAFISYLRIRKRTV